MLDVLDWRWCYFGYFSIGSAFPAGMLLVHAAIVAFALASSIRIYLKRDGTKEAVIPIYNEGGPVVGFHRISGNSSPDIMLH